MQNVSSPNPIFYHLLESSLRDDSNKWSNIGFCEEIDIIEIKICTLSVAMYVFTQVGGYAEEYMGKTLKDNNKVWNDVQSDFECCGIHKADDWIAANLSIPNSCCPSPTSGCNATTAYSDGCLDKFVNWLEDRIYIVGAIGIAFAFIQVRVQLNLFIDQHPIV